MESSIKRDQGTVVLSVTGVVDLNVGSAFRCALFEALEGARALLVDLSGVARADSSAVASLIEALDAARRAGTEFRFLAEPTAIDRLLDLFHLSDVFAAGTPSGYAA